MERRTRLGLTRVHCAEAAGIREGTLYRYETGRMQPSCDAAARLAKALSVSTDWLITGESVSEATLSREAC